MHSHEKNVHRERSKITGKRLQLPMHSRKTNIHLMIILDILNYTVETNITFFVIIYKAQSTKYIKLYCAIIHFQLARLYIFFLIILIFEKIFYVDLAKNYIYYTKRS